MMAPVLDAPYATGCTDGPCTDVAPGPAGQSGGSTHSKACPAGGGVAGWGSAGPVAGHWTPKRGGSGLGYRARGATVGLTQSNSALAGGPVNPQW